MLLKKVSYLVILSLVFTQHNLLSNNPEKQEEKVAPHKKRPYWDFSKEFICLGAIGMVFILIKYVKDLKKENDDLKLLHTHLLNIDFKSLETVHTKDTKDHALFYAKELDMETLVHRLAWVKAAYQRVAQLNIEEINNNEISLRKQFIIYLPAKGNWRQDTIKKAVTHCLIKYYAHQIETISPNNATLQLINQMYLQGLGISQQ